MRMIQSRRDRIPVYIGIGGNQKPKRKTVAEPLVAFVVLQISRIQVASVVAAALLNAEVSENKVKPL